MDVPEEPSRIISLSPAVTETLFMLGMGDRVVGVDSWSYRPREALKVRRVGSYATLNTNVVRELSPDLVLTTTGVQRPLIDQLKAAKVPVFPVPIPSTVFELISGVALVGGLVGKYEEGAKLAEGLHSRLVELSRLRFSTPVRAYIEIDLGGPTVPAFFSHITSALHLLNVHNVYGNVKQAYLYGVKVADFPLFDVSDVFRTDPDVVIYEFKRKQPSGEEVKELVRSRGWDKLRAVREGRLVVLPADTLAHHGPSFLDNLRECLVKVMDSLGSPSPSP
ncbi:iron ABC transporter substrate-binding protein [Sulfodiicoccus acidiphilus]|uniref:Iron ABC transporter substrate-binding protein n=1 Tax=Sulfodiicoccus acidiphilus TaxID=1670455 RepID=A0A830H5G2_9CREN|nr:iron ABC transporter substrate-binding protein [Sulfodiicoccus acidiphilus]